MKVELQICRHLTLLSLTGDLDAEGVDHSREKIMSMATEVDHTLVVDLQGVGFLDSSGVGILVYLFKECSSRKKRMLLVGAKAQPKRLLDFLRMGRIIECHANMNALLQHEGRVQRSLLCRLGENRYVGIKVGCNHARGFIICM